MSQVKLSEFLAVDIGDIATKLGKFEPTLLEKYFTHLDPILRNVLESFCVSLVDPSNPNISIQDALDGFLEKKDFMIESIVETIPELIDTLEIRDEDDSLLLYTLLIQLAERLAIISSSAGLFDKYGRFLYEYKEYCKPVIFMQLRDDIKESLNMT